MSREKPPRKSWRLPIARFRCWTKPADWMVKPPAAPPIKRLTHRKGWAWLQTCEMLLSFARSASPFARSNYLLPKSEHRTCIPFFNRRVRRDRLTKGEARKKERDGEQLRRQLPCSLHAASRWPRLALASPSSAASPLLRELIAPLAAGPAVSAAAEPHQALARNGQVD